MVAPKRKLQMMSNASQRTASLAAGWPLADGQRCCSCVGVCTNGGASARLMGQQVKPINCDKMSAPFERKTTSDKRRARILINERQQRMLSKLAQIGGHEKSPLGSTHTVGLAKTNRKLQVQVQVKQQQQQKHYLCQKINLINWLALVSAAAIYMVAGLAEPVDSLTINVRAQPSKRSIEAPEGDLQALASGQKPSNASSASRRKAELGAASGGGGARSSKLLLEVDALHYLQRYGYMNETAANANLVSEESYKEAVMTFQRFAGIPETGTIDGQTVEFMRMPRCGNKDRNGKPEESGRKKRRRKRYALQGSKWRRQELTYRISQYPTKFLQKKHDVDRQIEKAFRIWSQVAPIDFVVKQEGRVHIEIRFASGEHGDGDPFDGPGNTLAHAYFPQYGGDAHFDDQEYWTVDSYSGTNIFQVAAHELGHSLGLGHSSVREALMAPFYQKYKPNFKLHPDDILGIQSLYGEKTSNSGGGDDDDDDQPGSPSTPDETSRRYPPRASTTTTTSTTTSTPSPAGDSDSGSGFGGFFGFGSGGGGGGSSKAADLCQDSAIDAITRVENGDTYAFKGQYYWQISNEGLSSGYPAKIGADWDGLPGNLDAALTWSDGKTFFFKGDKYWRFFNKRREPGYPKQISAGFSGIPNNIEAALVWGGNGKTYFFKKDKYWRFDSKQEPPVSSQYPKSIKNWSGLPSSGIDAAFKWENGMTYFFKNNLYYRFDDREFEVDTSARPSFPRSTAEWWFGCATSSSSAIKVQPNSTNSNNNNNNFQFDSAASSMTAVQQQQRPSASGVQPEAGEVPAARSRTRPGSGGNSLSRSILTSLSALFPSVSYSSHSSQQQQPAGQSSSSSSSQTAGQPHSDWSIHRGQSEEVKRLLKTARSLDSHRQRERASDRHQYGNHNNNQHQYHGGSPTSRRSSEVLPDNTRWTFPLELSNREQSLSELKLDTNRREQEDDSN